MLAAIFLAAELQGRETMAPGQTTALGALLHHVTGGANAELFQPMNVNFGLFTPIDMPRGKRKLGKKERAFAYCERARSDIEPFLNSAAA